MSYIGTINKTVSCIYGPFNIIEGQEVPMLYAVKFPHYVTKINDPVVEIPNDIPIEIEFEETEEETKTKKERKGTKL